ncbi:hypothetical protein ACFQZE_07320 [Paenibacillus sp. GCM10027627]|uniref:hypothetical protein n=1 Tax=unclassified Paenibacillus TaxID=185978 RepID=UPI003631D749
MTQRKRFSKKVETEEISPQQQKKKCTYCQEERNLEKFFYKSNSKFHVDGRVSLCKVCISANVESSDLQSVKVMLLHLNRPFLTSYWDSAIIEGEKKGQEPFGLYLKSIQLNAITKDLTWLESDYESKQTSSVAIQTGSTNDLRIVENTSEDEKNRVDVIRMIGYDPFLFENENDKRGLYNSLVDFLDESTLEDSFKLPVVIEIVKAFNQLDKLNSALALMLSDTRSMTINTGSISSLIATKEKVLKTVLALAKDNGISVNHNNNKSKGGNTLNGIVKKLNEIGLEAATVNLFDLETCDAMKQIADISHRSILDQLVFDENDYAEMLSEQRNMIKKLEEKSQIFEEDNRQLKIKIKVLESSIPITELL